MIMSACCAACSPKAKSRRPASNNCSKPINNNNEKFPMKFILSLAGLLLIAPTTWGQQTLIKYDWQDLAQKGQLRGAVPVLIDGREALKIENTNDTPLQLT